MPTLSDLLTRMVFGRTLDALDLDRSARTRVRAEVRELMEADFVPFPPLRMGASRTESAGRRRRLAGGWIYAAPFVPATMMLAMLAAYMFLDSRGWWGWTLLVPILIVQVVVSAIVMSWILRRSTTPYLAAILSRRGIAICERCGYAIATGVGASADVDAPDRCPECGFEAP